MATPPVDGVQTAELLTTLHEAGSQLLTLAAGANLTTPVPACPDWDLAGLLGHLGVLWIFHASQLTRGKVSAPDPDTRPEPPPARELLPWATGGLERLLAVLSELPPGAPAWNWAHQPPTVGFWQRRMAHEALVHRRDTEQALGLPLTRYGPLAPDGLAELLSVFLPRRRHREPWTGPTGRVALQPTDGPERWLLAVGAGDRLVVERRDGAAEAVLAGTAEQLLLAGWGREPLAPLLRTGDLALAAGFLAE